MIKLLLKKYCFKWVILYGVVKISFYNENSYEESIIELFETLGYNHYYGPEIERDYKILIEI